MIFFNPQSNYCWHPLSKYIDEVKFRVGIICTLKSKPYPRDFKDFLKVLENDLTLETPEFPDSSELLEIFNPLIINQWNQLVLFKYGNYIDLNDKGYGTNFFELHDGLYLHCRSIVFDIGVNIWGTPQVALASMDKFKNYNEDNDEWSDRVINANFMLANKIEVTDKMDGSYQQYTNYKGQIIGSGSQAIDPDVSWRLQKGLSWVTDKDKPYYSLIRDYSSWTFQFEFIHPKNQIVVNYPSEKQGLYLFNARNNLTGNEMDFEFLQQLAKAYNVPMVENYGYKTLNDILSQTDKYPSNEKEGWVINLHFKNSFNKRIKIKCDDYVLIHKALSRSISPNAVIQSIYYGKFDDLISKVPDGFKDITYDYAGNVMLYLEQMEEKVTQYYVSVSNAIPDFQDKKAFMIKMKEIVPKKFQGYVINKYLGRENSYLERAGSVEGSRGFIKMKDITDFLESGV